MVLVIILIIITISIIAYLNKNKIDTFAGALTQLYAKGPEDNYLTVGTEKYVPPFPFMFWNMPTRLQYPLYYIPYYPLFGYY